jgi:hypothetical protein
MLDDAGISRWLSLLPNEEGRERKLMENGQARRCMGCHRPIDIKHLDMAGKCPDCGGMFGWMLKFPSAPAPEETPEPERVHPGIQVMLGVLIAVAILSAAALSHISR